MIGYACRKKTRPLRILQQYSPALALLELVILLIVILTSNSSIKYGNHRNASLQTKIDAREREYQSLMVSLVALI